MTANPARFRAPWISTGSMGRCGALSRPVWCCRCNGPEIAQNGGSPARIGSCLIAAPVRNPRRSWRDASPFCARDAGEHRIGA